MKMQVVRELIDGVVPSHKITITVDVRVFGVILTLHQLQFKGSHANRTLWNQSITEGNVIIREQDDKLIAVLNADSWNDIVDCTISAQGGGVCVDKISFFYQLV